MSQITFFTVLHSPWTQIEPIQIGRTPTGRGTPERFVVVESEEGSVLRLDLYHVNGECFAFEEACTWSGFVVVGWGHCVYLIEPRTRKVSSLDLGSYFGHLYPTTDSLLVASAEQLFRIESDGSLLWQSDILRIDGVVVEQIEDGIIRGKGQIDPPEGWKPFLLSFESGQRV